MGRPVVHFEINGKDAKKLHDFYGSLFDWHIDANNPVNYGVVDTHSEGGIGGGIGSGDGPNQVTFYIQVEDPQAYLTKIEAKGGKTVVPVTEIPGMVTFAQFADPEGNIVGLVKAEQPRA
jgi:predicted enzyme related to lactoylglutathione lyase